MPPGTKLNINLLQSALDPAVIASGFAQNGQAQQEAGQVASLTSTNNFINFCLTTKLPITNGQQITSGSCNPAPMGVIAAQSKMPSSKFTNPVNGQVIKANTAFTISMAIQNLQTGNFVNPNTNYFSAPQQVDGSGNIIGHSHVVVDALKSLTQTQPTDPTKFSFFKGLNAAAQGGVLTADVTEGLPAGTYRLSSINTAANHQPALVAVAQHGALDDQVYVSDTILRVRFRLLSIISSSRSPTTVLALVDSVVLQVLPLVLPTLPPLQVLVPVLPLVLVPPLLLARVPLASRAVSPLLLPARVASVASRSGGAVSKRVSFRHIRT